jgi:hypothetical protein
MSIKYNSKNKYTLEIAVKLSLQRALLGEIPGNLETVHELSFCRFSGSFEPIFDSNLRGQYRQEYIAPANWIEKRPK